MLLNSNSYRRAEVEKERHNLFVDFSENGLFDGPDRSFQSINVELPYPVQDPLSVDPDAEDPFKKLIKEKKQYEDKIKHAQRKNLLKSVEDAKLNGSDYRYMDKSVLELYQCKDPDEALRTDYNVYYANGILDTVCLHDTRYLLWPKMNGTIHFLNIADNCDSFSISSPTNAPIYSLRTYCIDTHTFVLLRYKYCITILQILDTKVFSSIFEDTFNKPVIDAKINWSNRNCLGVIDIDGEFIIKYIKSNKIFFKKKNRKFENKLLQFEFWEDNTVILMDEFLVQLFDYKSRTLLKTFDPKLMACNQLCNFRVLDKTLFLCSRHYLIKTSLSKLTEFSTFAHTLGCAPLFMDVLRSDKDGYLCLSNHLQDSKILFTGNVMFGLPYKVPGIQATLRESILRNSKLVLQEKLSERLDFSIAGLKLIEFDGKVFIYFVNSLGEIFRQEMSYQPVDNLQAVEKLCTWIGKLNDPEPSLYITNFAEMGDAFLFLSKPLPSLVEKKDFDKSNVNNFLNKFKPIYKKNNLKSTFAKRFLDIWEDSEESEDEEPIIKDTEVPYYDKVNKWMEEYNVKENDIASINIKDLEM